MSFMQKYSLESSSLRVEHKTGFLTVLHKEYPSLIDAKVDQPGISFKNWQNKTSMCISVGAQNRGPGSSVLTIK